MYEIGFAFGLVGIAFAAALIVLGRLLSPGLATEPARRPFEAGSDPAVHAWTQYHPRFLCFALIFILFDMEMVFMYPWAVVFFETGWKAFVEMGMFISILVLGILYAWRERAFEWD